METFESSATAPAALSTTQDVARHCQVTTRTLANWRASGRVPFVRITARCIRYRLADVEKALSK